MSLHNNNYAYSWAVLQVVDVLRGERLNFGVVLYFVGRDIPAGAQRISMRCGTLWESGKRALRANPHLSTESYELFVSTLESLVKRVNREEHWYPSANEFLAATVIGDNGLSIQYRTYGGQDGFVGAGTFDACTDHPGDLLQELYARFVKVAESVQK